MNINDPKTIEQLEQFLTGTQPIAFVVASSQVDIYRDIQRTLVKFRYPGLDKRSKDVVMRFLIKMAQYVFRTAKQREQGTLESRCLNAHPYHS